MYSNVTICNYSKCNSFWKNVRLQFIVERVKIPESLDLTGFAGTKKHRPRGNRFVRKNSAFSAPSGVRTLDTLIKSQVLYQLS